ncbi:MAG: 16S rRNA (adenine(1518)-N(6)/adenine(1519)-N(6))-dimethyltransferase RsmA [Candidatus Omnitrophica bacterium]|jgi:16S rRNA (adenine1518-N6/adenine1519-N6)-dimethyltransferase|nr:16S rRNA (adenine(1518)-N(6)/adenine(1519)-N(6))-dimethyltransferase RsmA [Candidatus Omnitrophota bacterium]
MRLSHSLGQVFLTEKNYIQKIINSLVIEDEIVLEIGSGPGEISAAIGKRCKFLYCVEFDPRFVSVLEQKFKNERNVRVIHSDILKFNLSERNERLVIFGNVPYQISNSLISYLIDNRTFIKKAYLTFQKEFVDKLIAETGNKDYGFLSCFIQYYAGIEKIFDIPRGAFTPVPKIDSSFISLDFYDEPQDAAEDENLLIRIIREAFNQRRKKISNSLSKFIASDDFFSSLKVDPNARAENVSLKEYVDIANKVYKERLKNR